MLIECAPISVAVRTSLATANERWNSWLSVLPRAPAVLGGAHRVLHLAEDLGFAEHHRIEAAGHAEGMARDLAVVQGVGMRAQQGGGHAAALGQPADRVVDRGMVGGAVDLGAVAGRDDGAPRLPGWRPLENELRRLCRVGAIWSSANAKRPRRSSGAVVVLPRAYERADGGNRQPHQAE